MTIRFISRRWVGLLLMPLSAAYGGNTGGDIPEDIPLQPAVVAYAKEHSIPLERFEIADSSARALPGDTMVALITLRDAGIARQWLTQFTVAVLTDKERASSPNTESKVQFDNGHTYIFNSGEILALEIATTGPFGAGEKTPPAERHTRASLNLEFLGLGLDSACSIVLNAFENSEPNEVPKTVTLSEQQERTFAGLSPALNAMFESIQNTPGLREILWEIAEKPSVWSIVRRGGKIEPSMDLGDKSRWGIVAPLTWAPAGVPIYRLSPSLLLNRKLAVDFSLIVVAPRPPLLTTAGVIGIVATSPGSKSKRLDIRVLAARRASEQK